MSTRGAVPIVCGVDRAYVDPLCVMLASVAHAHGDAAHELRVVVLHDGLAGTDLRTVQRVADRLGLAVKFRPAPHQPDTWPVSGWVSKAVYLRLAVADVFPDSSRVLYLDTDTLVLQDLRPLLDLDLAGAPLGAVRDPQNPVLELGIAMPGWAQLGLPGDREYFNSGVMLLDLDVCRASGMLNRAAAFLADHPRSARFWDQDALNWAASDSWQRLDRRWNTFVVTPLIERGGYVHYAEPVMPLADLVEDETRAAILHFAGPDKPWHDQYPAGPHRELYRHHRRSIDDLRSRGA